MTTVVKEASLPRKRAVGLVLGPLLFVAVLAISTPPNAIVYGSGLVPLNEMIASGIWLDVAGGILIWVGLRIICPLVGVM